MSDENIEQTAALLKEFEPGFLPYPIFEQVARLVALPIVEFIPLRQHNGATEVLLIARPGDDALWPGMLHTPGTVVRATDINKSSDMWEPLRRILHDELFDTECGPHHFVGSQLHASKRGAEQAQIYWIEVIGEPKIGDFFPISKLPTDLMDSQRAFITQSVQYFERFKSKNQL